MLYPNLQININKKRGTSGLDDAQLINTPVILDLAVQIAEDKNNFAFNQHPTLNRLDEKHLSLQTPILDLNHTPFFNQTSSAVSPSDSLNSFVAPNDILNTYTTAISSTSTSTTNAFDLNQQTSQLNSNTLQLQSDLNHLNIPNKLLQASKQHQQQQDSNIHQDYQFTTTPYTSSAQQVNQYPTNLLNNQSTDLNANNITHHLDQQQQIQQQQQAQHNLTYTELKTSNQHLIPNSVYDVTGGYKSSNQKHQDQPPSYLPPSSPANSTSSQTSSSNLDHQDGNYMYGESSSTPNKMNRRYPGGQSSSQSEKKSRMTKKQKYDAMINEEKNLVSNNEQLKTDIKNLENMIVRYKQTIMNTVKSNR